MHEREEFEILTGRACMNERKEFETLTGFLDCMHERGRFMKVSIAIRFFRGDWIQISRSDV